jgi:hypothetical protein
MPISPELSARIDAWRSKARDGTLTQDEMREAVALIREGRVSAQATSTAARAKKAAKVIPTANDMLKEMGL